MSNNVAVLEISINKYGGGNDLRGCRQDMLDRRAMLAEMGLVTVSRIELMDSLATLANIKFQLAQLFLVKNVDGYFVHISGHGTIARDVSGDERNDFAFVPFNWERDGFLLDDEIGELLKRAPKGKFVGVFVDACHSESGARGLFQFNTRAPQALNILPRRLSTAKHTKEAIQATARRRQITPKQEKERGLFDFLTKRRSGSTGVLFTQDDCLYWGAAQSNKTADDAFINGMYRGAGTYYQVTAYRMLRAELAARGSKEQPTWEAINKRGNELLTQNGHQHRMQLDGRAEIVRRAASIL